MDICDSNLHVVHGVLICGICVMLLNMQVTYNSPFLEGVSHIYKGKILQAMDK